jgi:hypothetical protein
MADKVRSISWKRLRARGSHLAFHKSVGRSLRAGCRSRNSDCRSNGAAFASRRATSPLPEARWSFRRAVLHLANAVEQSREGACEVERDRVPDHEASLEVLRAISSFGFGVCAVGHASCRISEAILRDGRGSRAIRESCLTGRGTILPGRGGALAGLGGTLAGLGGTVGGRRSRLTGSRSSLGSRGSCLAGRRRCLP